MTIAQIQWELDTWIQHYLAWARSEKSSPTTRGRSQSRADACDRALSILVAEFGVLEKD